jgi:hypothetical protein
MIIYLILLGVNIYWGLGYTQQFVNNSGSNEALLGLMVSAWCFFATIYLIGVKGGQKNG